MWPEDEEDDELDEVAEEDDGDEDAVIERIEAAFRQEHARIRGATNREWLHRLRANYEAEIADLALVGVAADRAHDLIDLIYERLAELEAAEQRRLRLAEDAAAAARQRAELAARDRRHREAAARRQSAERDRREQERERARQERAAADRRKEREREAEAEQRTAAARLANAKAAEIEARAAVLKAQAARAAAASPDPVERQARRAPRPAPQAASEPMDVDSAAAEPSTMPIEEADRAALMAVGRWPPPDPRPDSPFWSPDAHWPTTWTLTGFDLAELRGRMRVTQRVFAGQLGVATVEVSRAEAQPREKVRPALQVALRRVLDEHLRRHAPGAADGAHQEAPPPLTGSDLARFRAASGLTQRQAATLLGVAHGTVAKAELAGDKALGEQLDRALRLVGRG